MLAEQGLGPPLSDWEKQFLEEVEARIETYGSAFHDSEKGAPDEALSALQHVKLREIDKKARGKAKSGFGSKGGFKRKSAPRVRQLNEDLEETPPVPEPSKPALVRAVDITPKDTVVKKPSGRPKPRPTFTVIEGGADKD